MLNIFVFFQMF